jgi:hypothetical protein
MREFQFFESIIEKCNFKTFSTRNYCPIVARYKEHVSTQKFLSLIIPKCIDYFRILINARGHIR